MKNAQVSTAMLADKMANVMSTKAEVLDAYAGQFEANSASTYTLTGLQPSAIDVSGESGSSDLGYSISSGASGSISFGFTREDDRWLIDDIRATC